MTRVAVLLTALFACTPALASAQEAVPVAIIGTGNVGGARGPRLAALGHPVIYGRRDPGRHDVRDLVGRTGVRGSAASASSRGCSTGTS